MIESGVNVDDEGNDNDEVNEQDNFGQSIHPSCSRLDVRQLILVQICVDHCVFVGAAVDISAEFLNHLLNFVDLRGNSNGLDQDRQEEDDA